MSREASRYSRAQRPNTAAANDSTLNHDVEDVVAVRHLESDTPDSHEALASRQKEIQFWLDWQSRMISGVIRSAVYLCSQSESEEWSEQFHWPEGSSGTSVLQDLAKESVRTRQPIYRNNASDETGLVDIIVHPLSRNLAQAGAVLFVLSPRSASQRESVTQLLQWCMTWLESILETRLRNDEGSSEGIFHSISLLSMDLPLEISANQVCGYLADKFDCSLVAMGSSDGLHTNLIAVSNQLAFDRRTAKIQQIEFAMEECRAQKKRILVPKAAGDKTTIINAHTQLQNQVASSTVCSVPLLAHGEQCGVLTFIKSANQEFTRHRVDQLERIGAYIGALLPLQVLARQTAWQRARRSVLDFQTRLLGPGYLKTKTVALISLLLLVLLVLVPADYKLSTTVSIEGAMQQSIVAPVSGYIKNVYVRAGDSVKANQALVDLDGSDLEIERENLLSEKNKLEKEYHLAWAERDKARVTIAASRMEQSSAQLELIESNLRHTTLTAPFDGILISGDLNERVGAPIERGQSLFELAPIDGYKAILHVSEYDVGRLRDGQRGSIRLTGLPEESINFHITKAFPVAVAQNGGNFFRVEAVLDAPPHSLRPGMQGIGKIIVGRGSLAGAWSRSLRERMKLRLWYYGF